MNHIMNIIKAVYTTVLVYKLYKTASLIRGWKLRFMGWMWERRVRGWHRAGFEWYRTWHARHPCMINHPTCRHTHTHQQTQIQSDLGYTSSLDHINYDQTREIVGSFGHSSCNIHINIQFHLFWIKYHSI